MSEREARPSRLPWPPIIYVGAILLGVLLNLFLPLPWIGRPMSDFLFAVGAVAMAAALFVHVAAVRTMSRAGTTVLPHRASAHLVTAGPFALSRNPIYLAFTTFLLALGLVTGVAWYLPLALIAAFAVQKLAIEPEEEHLSLRFGKRYRDYRRSVRRWI